MKRLFLIIAILTLFALLFSCNNTDLPKVPEDTVPETGNTGNPEFDNVIPDEEFEFPANPQKYVVKYIRDMALTPWKPETTFQLTGKYQAWSYNLTYEEGVKYYGPPFLTDSRGSMQEFNFNIDEGIYVGSTSNSDCIGSACYDAVYLSLIQVCPSISFESTEDMLPKNETGLLPVGEWDWELSKHDTKTIIAAHKIYDMANAYAELKPGDVVLKHIVAQDAGHTRIVSGGPVLYYNSDGSLNYNRSYITCIEQTNAWDKTVTHNTTWFVDHVYTFEDLYKNNFVPLRPADYDQDVSRAALTAEDMLTEDQVAKARKLTGTLKSNHYITEVKVTITNPEGKTIYEKAEFPNVKTFEMADFEYRPALYNYESGKYHFLITASLSFGTKTVADFDFNIE